MATWLYSDIASTPSASPSLRMLSDSIPLCVGEGDGGVQHPLPAQRDAGRSAASGRGAHLRAPLRSDP